MARFGLFGDSYIKRLQNFCDGDLHVPGSTRFVHRGGLRCDGIDEMMEKKLTAAAEKTDIVFLSIGGNDISPISKPEKIYDDIKSLIEKLKEAGVRRVFISEILPRADFKKKCSLWSYQVQIREGQEENKPTSERDVRNRCHQVQRHTAAQRLSP